MERTTRFEPRPSPWQGDYLQAKLPVQSTFSRKLAFTFGLYSAVCLWITLLFWETSAADLRLRTVPAMQQELLNYTDVMTLLGVSDRRTIRKRIAQSRFPAPLIFDGGQPRFRKSEVTAWISDRHEHQAGVVWDTAQTVTVIGVSDDLVDGTQTTILTFWLVRRYLRRQRMVIQQGLLLLSRVGLLE